MSTIDELKEKVEKLTEENARLKIERDIALMDLQIIHETENGGDDERATFYRGLEQTAPFDIDAFIAGLRVEAPQA